MEFEDVKLEPEDYDSMEEDFTSPLDAENDLEHLIAMPGKHGKIRRPPNAFMLFAREHRRIISGTHPQVPNKQISSILGNKWRNLDPSMKSEYYVKAKALDSAHKQHYPDYVYNPKEARERKKSRQIMKRNRKLRGLSKFGKERQFRLKSNLTEPYFEDGKNGSYSNEGTKTESNSSISYNELNSMPLRNVSPGYLPPDVLRKYPLVGAMEDPPTEQLSDTRQHLLKFLSDHSGRHSSPQVQNCNRTSNATPLPSSTVTCDNGHFEPYNFRASSPITSPESVTSKNQAQPDSILPDAVPETSNSARVQATKVSPQESLGKPPEYQHHCKCSDNARTSGMRMHCACPMTSYPMFDGSTCHPPTPPIAHPYYSRSYMSPYMANPYGMPPIYSMPYMSLSQASSESPSILPNVYHAPPPNMYHTPGAICAPRYHPFFNSNHLQEDEYTPHARFPPYRMTDYRGGIRRPSQAARHAETAIAEADEDKDGGEAERPPSSSSLNNSSSNLVIITDNLENN